MLENRALMVGQDHHLFAHAINQLIRDYSLRQSLGYNGTTYARTELTPERCFAPLFKYLRINAGTEQPS